MADNMSVLFVYILALTIVLCSLSLKAYALNDPVKVIAKSSFVDSMGRLNIVGTLRNTGTMPVQATVGLKIEDETRKTIEQQPTFGRIIWPLNDSPFKFIVKSGTAGEP